MYEMVVFEWPLFTQKCDNSFTLLCTNAIGIPLSHMALSDYRWGGVYVLVVKFRVC